MVTKVVKKNVTKNGTKWEQALADAEVGLGKAKKDVMQWRGTIAVIRGKIKQGASWPGDNASESPSA